MDRDNFVQNIKMYCALKGMKPTTACRESGVGGSFINDIERGKTPSVAKVQLLAQYLGCTVSDLLGEKNSPAEDGEADMVATTPAERELLRLLRSFPEEDQARILAAIEMLLRTQELQK